MTRTLTLVAAAMTLSTGIAFADAHMDPEACNSMLATAVGNQLVEEGFDMARACDLTVAELAQIKGLMDEEGMGAREQIEMILAGE